MKFLIPLILLCNFAHATVTLDFEGLKIVNETSAEISADDLERLAKNKFNYNLSNYLRITGARTFTNAPGVIQLNTPADNFVISPKRIWRFSPTAKIEAWDDKMLVFDDLKFTSYSLTTGRTLDKLEPTIRQLGKYGVTFEIRDELMIVTMNYRSGRTGMLGAVCGAIIGGVIAGPPAALVTGAILGVRTRDVADKVLRLAIEGDGSIVVF